MWNFKPIQEIDNFYIGEVSAVDSESWDIDVFERFCKSYLKWEEVAPFCCGLSYGEYTSVFLLENPRIGQVDQRAIRE